MRLWQRSVVVVKEFIKVPVPTEVCQLLVCWYVKFVHGNSLHMILCMSYSYLYACLRKLVMHTLLVSIVVQTYLRQCLTAAKQWNRIDAGRISHVFFFAGHRKVLVWWSSVFRTEIHWLVLFDWGQMETVETWNLEYYTWNHLHVLAASNTLTQHHPQRASLWSKWNVCC